MGAECWEQDGEHNGIVVYKIGIKGDMVVFYYLGDVSAIQFPKKKEDR